MAEVTVPLQRVAPDRYRAVVDPGSLGSGVVELEKTASDFLLRLPDEPQLTEPGLTLVENAIGVTDRDRGAWVTVWKTDGEVEDGATITFHLDDDEIASASEMTKSESPTKKEPHMATTTTTDRREAANGLLALEQHRNAETDPVMQHRLDRAIANARSEYAEMRGIVTPEAARAVGLRKAEHEISSAGIAQRRAAELRKADPSLSQYAALVRATRDPEVQRAHADEAGIAA